MSITFHLPAVLSRLTNGERALTAEGATLGNAVTSILTRFPALKTRLVDDAGNPYAFITFYLNDEDIRFKGGFGAAVKDGDEITVIPAVAGG